VYAKEDHELPLVHVAIVFRGGRYLDPPGKEGLSTIAGEAWRAGGAGNRTARQLDKDLDFLAAIVVTSIDDVSGNVTLNVLKKDLEKAMKIVMDLLINPKFQEDRLRKTKDNLIQSMKTRNDHAALIEAREWDRLIYGDEYWLNRLPTKESVEAVTADDCKRLVSALVRSDNIVLAVSGDFEWRAMKELLDGTIGKLPRREEPLPAVPQPRHTPEPGVYCVNKSDVNQGRVSIGHIGFRLGHPDEFPLRAVNEIIGGAGFTSRMMKRVRSDEALAYGAISVLGFQVTFPGTFRAFFQSKSSTCSYATQIVFDILNDVRTKGVTSDELETTKAKLVETLPQSFQSAAETVALYATDEVLGRPHSHWSRFSDRVRALTKDQLQIAAENRIKPDKMIVLVVGNIKDITEGHPKYDARLEDFGEIHELPLRDPLTLETMKE
jgi:zinc protease